MIQVIPNNKPILKIRARESPIFLALACLSAGSLLDTMEIKIILSTPNTISKNVSVSRATHDCGCRSISMISFLVKSEDKK
jgi:hypothetical protein